MMHRTGGFTTILVVVLVLGGFGLLLYNNSQPSAPLRAVVPTQPEPTVASNPWDQLFRPGFGDNSTPLPTIAIPDQPFVAPTISETDNENGTPFEASELLSQDLFTLEPVSAGATPTPPPPTAAVLETTNIAEQDVAARPTIPWQPPPLSVPQNRDPLGRDHYAFARPVDSSGQNFGIFNYPYGSTGRQFNTPELVHHGIDMPNEVGSPVRAAESGTVIFASSEETPFFQGTASYGNVVFIEHEFGAWNNQAVFSLYAHMQSALVSTGDYVERGQVIGLIGNSGRSSGAHLHFEVRVGAGRYSDTYNPVLWVVPYVGHGTIAGRLLDGGERFINEADITLRRWDTGLIVTSTTTYHFDDTVDDVNSDPNWQENFVFSDIPVGRYEVISNYDGLRLSQVVNVMEGRTTSVELKPVDIATAQAISDEQP